MCFKSLSKSTVITLALFASVLSPASSLAQEKARDGNAAAGARSWADNCSRCHNMRDPSDLRDDQWITSVSHMRIRAGLTGQQARDILAFLQDANSQIASNPVTFDKNSSADAASLSGQEVYNQTCVACHGANGKGAVPGTPDLTKPRGALAQADSVLLDRITDGYKSPGSAMAMPPKGGNPSLTDNDIRAVLSYMRQRFGQ